MKIKNAEVIYTGGGIYVFHAELDDGTFTMSESISFNEYTLVVDSNPSEDFDNAYYPEWQEQHKVSEMLMEESRKFNIELIDWLISNPGSYPKSDLEFFKKCLTI